MYENLKAILVKKMYKGSARESENFSYPPIQSVNTDAIFKVSNLETINKQWGTSAWEQRSIAHSKLEIDLKSH